MADLQAAPPIARPTICPFCDAKAVDTLAKVFTAKTLWRCRQCEGTWTLGSVVTPNRRR
jgi:ribosomal protein L37AE/L43A